ncbi:MAG: hypothetical protein EZS28_014242 [Streblomastix strix]|uniref:Uncharacterized protein n=1 Tax=Streblomastix strix TaxID=222440 RepID=A0A5J4W6U7_9EUKA|nr:MAG: hypothetical protein EZS28_014242 [Streblomastix strix]
MAIYLMLCAFDSYDSELSPALDVRHRQLLLLILAEESADYGIRVREVRPILISFRRDFCSFIVKSAPIVNCELKQFNLLNNFAESFKRYSFVELLLMLRPYVSESLIRISKVLGKTQGARYKSKGIARQRKDQISIAEPRQGFSDGCTLM